MLAVGLLVELEPNRRDRDFLHSAVSDALLHWALMLRGDGRPRAGSVARSPLPAAAAYHVVLLLTETAGHHHELLLSELDRHLHWLARRPPMPAWMEAALVAALGDAGVLLRQRDRIHTARARLSGLLARQNEEGWFPEPDQPDIGRLSLTVDALARCYRHNDWPELEMPLRRALRFLTSCTPAMNVSAACVSSLGTSFISPLGPEWLQAEMPDAASLAAHARRSFGSPDRVALLASDECASAVLGASALCSLHVSPTAHRQLDAPLPERAGRTDFANAGWTLYSTSSYDAVVNTDRAGLLHVAWRNGMPPLADAGAVVVTGRRTLTAAHRPVRAEWISYDRFHCEGRLHRPHSPPAANSVPRGPVQQTRERQGNAANGSVHTVFSAKSVPIGGFRRELVFEPDGVRIIDDIHVALACEAVMFAVEPPRTAEPFVAGGTGFIPAEPPVRIEGGRNIRVVRVYRQGRLVDQQTHRT
jgi:hypothetical protein